MADQKITDLTEYTTPKATDVIEIVDIQTTPVNKKITLTSLGIIDGWTPAGETWTYASASTITVPSGAAAKYAIGDRIRWKQGGAYKYGVLTTVADTLLTIAVNTDYTVADAAITDNYYSHQISPVGYPHWFNVTAPTFNTAYYDNGSGSQPTVSSNKMSITGREVHIHLVSNGVKAGTDGFISMTTTSVYPTPNSSQNGVTIGYSYTQTSGNDMRSSYVLIDSNTPSTWWILLYATNIADNTTMTKVGFHAIYEI